MEIWLTDGMFGKKLKKLAVVNSAEDAMAKIQTWKADSKNKAQYKIELYDRIIFGESCVAVDFGSWSTFMQIDGLTKSDMEKIA